VHERITVKYATGSRASRVKCCVIGTSAVPAGKICTGSATGGMTIFARAFMERLPRVNVTVLPALGGTGGINAPIGEKIEMAVSNRKPIRLRWRVST
jgi:hypothetical protein